MQSFKGIISNVLNKSHLVANFILNENIRNNAMNIKFTKIVILQKAYKIFLKKRNITFILIYIQRMKIFEEFKKASTIYNLRLSFKPIEVNAQNNAASHN